MLVKVDGCATAWSCENLTNLIFSFAVLEMVIYWEGVAVGDIQDEPFFQCQSSFSSGRVFLSVSKLHFITLTDIHFLCMQLKSLLIRAQLSDCRCPSCVQSCTSMQPCMKRTEPMWWQWRKQRNLHRSWSTVW